MGDFRQLTVYAKTSELADDLRARILGWESFDRWTTGVQLLRAVDSAGANLAEAFGRNSDLDERRFLHIVRGSVLEAEHWVERAIARELLDPSFEERTREIGRLINGLLRRHRAKALMTDD